MNNSINAEAWLKYIENEIGFVLPKTQHRWLSNAVMATAKSNSLTAQQLWLAVKKDHQLRQQLFDAVLILESRFFRHLPSLQYVTTLAVEYMATKSKTLANKTTKSALAPKFAHATTNQSVNGVTGSKQTHHTVVTGSTDTLTVNQIDQADNVSTMSTSTDAFRVWSVGCSKGQEVWSLAMMLDEQHITNYQILGTDISKQAIKQASTACYTARERAFIPYSYQQYMIDNGEQADNLTAERWQVTAKLRKQVQFAYHNIFTTTMPTTILQNVIICQNVLIYFRQFDQRDILARLVTQCQLGGHIILAPGEAVSWHHPKMQRVSHPDVNAWCKIKA